MATDRMGKSTTAKSEIRVKRQSMDKKDNISARLAWNAIARFWNDQLGDGNDFSNRLVWRDAPSPGRPPTTCYLMWR